MSTIPIINSELNMPNIQFQNKVTIINMTSRLEQIKYVQKNTVELNDELFNSQTDDNIYYYKFENPLNTFLTMKSSNPVLNFIKYSPSVETLENIWNVNKKNRTKEEIVNSILHSLRKMNIHENKIPEIQLQDSINKMYDVLKNPKKTADLINEQFKDKSVQEKVLNIIGGLKKTKSCDVIPSWKELKGFKDVQGFWKKILLPLDYNAWIWKKISCKVKPWICPLAPIFCLEEYVYELGDSDSKYWKVFSWIVFIIVELIDIIFIILGTVLDFVVVGSSIPFDILSIIWAFVRFDIVGVIFGTIGIIPYIGSAAPVFVKTSRSVMKTLERTLGVGLKALKNKKIFSSAKFLFTAVMKIIDAVENISTFTKLMKMGEIIGTIGKSSDIITSILTFITSNPKKTIKILTLMNDGSDASLKLLTKFAINPVVYEFLIKISKSMKLADIVILVNFLGKIKSPELATAVSKVITFIANHGKLAKSLINQFVKTIESGASVTQKYIKNTDAILESTEKQPHDKNITGANTIEINAIETKSPNSELVKKT